MANNKFNKALRHLKSTELDEKIKRLNESPTNSMGGVYALNQPGHRLSRELDPAKVFYPDVDGNFPTGIPGTPGEPNYVRPAGYWDEGPGTTAANPYDTLYTADWSYSIQEDNPRNTETLIDSDTGYVRSELPPNSRSFILGPLVDLYFHNHSNDNRTYVGYVQKDTREFVLLGYVNGRWGNDDDGNLIYQDGFTSGRIWNGESSGFVASNSNFTFEMLQWFHNKLKAGLSVKNASFFNSGGQPIVSGGGGTGQPTGSVQGNAAGAGSGDASGGGDANVGSGTGGTPDIGTPQNSPNHGGPGDAGLAGMGGGGPGGKGGPGGPGDGPGDGPPLIDPETGQPRRDVTPEELAKFGEYLQGLAQKAMAGTLTPAEQKTFDMHQSDSIFTPVIDNEYERIETLKNKAPGTHTPAEKQALLNAGLDDFVQGGMKSTDIFGDLATLAGAAAVVKGAIAVGLGNIAKIASGVSLTKQVQKTVGNDPVNDAAGYNQQLAGKLVTSILSGQPQEIKLSPAAKTDQINNVTDTQFEKALQIKPAPKPSAETTVNPTPGLKKPFLDKESDWGAQGGAEASYDPKTDTLTITAEKMLRTGEKGDKFDITQGGKVSGGQILDKGKQTSFGDIPELSDKEVTKITKDIATGIFDPGMQGLSGVTQVVTNAPNTSNFTGGGLPGQPEPVAPPTWDQIKSNPDMLDKFTGNVGSVVNKVVTGAIQGTASNVVALRKALTNIGVPQSEVEKTGGGYGQVYSQTSYKGNEIPPRLRDIINKKTGGVRESKESREVLTESRKRILREIKQPYKMKETPKQKYKMNFKGKFTAQNTPDITSSKKSDDIVSAKNAAGQTWRTKDKYWSGYESQERMNIIYDHVGHGQIYWDTIVNENQHKKNMRDREIREHLNLIDHNKVMKEIIEQQTLDAPKDPLFKKVAKRLKTEIDYPDKPSKNGYPDTPPPEMVNGFHPEYGKKYKYDKLDPHSAEAMPATGNPKIDTNIQKSVDMKRKVRKLKNILGKRG